MAEVFQCPSCSGRLQFDGGDHATVRCDYCGNTVIVPESLRSRAQSVSTLYTQQNAMHEIVRLINTGSRKEAVQHFAKTFGVGEEQAREAVSRLADGLSLSTQHINSQAGNQGAALIRRVGCVAILIILLAVLGVVAIPLVLGGAAAWTIFSQEPAATQVAEIVSTVAFVELDTNTTPAYATLLQSTGSEGIAPGQFVDPRGLAVAPDGEIYVADYSNGRVQRFDMQGNALGVWQWDEDRVIQALSAGTQSDLYAVQGGDLVRFSRESGEALGSLTYESDRPVSFRDVATAPNGDVVALNHFNEFVRFDAAGNVLQVVDVEESASTLSVDDLALDGAGNVYLLGSYEDVLGKRHNGVFLFSNEGRYLSRFGSNGNEPGQFTSPSTLAIDGQGRIYVSDFAGILTFSNSGSYQGVTDTEGFVFGIAFNSAGEMLAVGNANKLFRYEVPGAGAP